MAERDVKILVVDDNPATLYATARVLRSAGFTVVEATSGNEALARAADGPAAVILDVNLPDIDGFAVCREIRAREQTARTPVIHLSATFVKDVDKVQGLEAGADGYLTHPVEPPVLIATVNAFVRARQAEDAMRASDAKFRAVFEHAPNGIALVSDALVYLEANPAMCRILGRARGEVVGRHLSAFVPQGRKGDVVAMSGPPGPGGAWRGTLPLVRADGEQVELEWAISAHSVPGVRLAVVTDVTERKMLESERERLLTSERAARAEAERANRLKDDFLATLSHELRTPLNAIVGWSQILKRGERDPADVAEGIDAIERNARVQAQLIEDLLDVSRITSGKLRLDVQPVDPAATINAALQSVAPAAASKEIAIERELDPAAGPIQWDPARLQQVVWNLVNNAVKFTPRGGTVRVRCERRKSIVTISVADTGQGVRPEFIPHLFERFRQADAGTRRGQGGLGLGLAIVKHLVEMHGGTVTAESPGEGMGATFTARLPLAAVRAAAPDSSDGVGGPAEAANMHWAEGPARPDPVDLAGVRVLVVEDDDDARSLIRRVLVERAAEVVDVGDVPAAVGAVGTFRPHLIVSDIGMPFQDGFDLIRLVRGQGHSGAALPAIALTAFAREEDRQQALAAGYQRHLAKPVDASELLAAIAALTRPAPPPAATS